MWMQSLSLCAAFNLSLIIVLSVVFLITKLEGEGDGRANR